MGGYPEFIQRADPHRVDELRAQSGLESFSVNAVQYA
jgi:hypothetical protein